MVFWQGTVDRRWHFTPGTVTGKQPVFTGASPRIPTPLPMPQRLQSALCSVTLISRNPAAQLCPQLHFVTVRHVHVTGSIPEPISVWGTLETRVISTWASRNKSIPGFKQKAEFLFRKNLGDTSVVFFCWSNPPFQTNRESGISKERLSFFNPLSWPIATAILQDSYKSLRNMNVMERSYELWEVGGGEGMHSSLKFCQMHPHSKSVLWNKECIAYYNAMAWTWVGLTFYCVVSQSSPHWIPSPQNSGQMWVLL